MSQTSTEESSEQCQKQLLVTDHNYLVQQIVHQLRSRFPSSVQSDDLIQAGQIGLIAAARTFKSDKGASFSTYAGIRIRGAIMDELRGSDWTPRSVSKHIREIAAATQRVEARKGFSACAREIAEELGITLKEFHKIHRLAAESRLASTEEYVDEDGSSMLNVPTQTEGPQEQLVKEAQITRVSEAIEQLPEKEKLVLSLYYDEEMNLKEIAVVLGVSESRVSQIHIQAVNRLRKDVDNRLN